MNMLKKVTLNSVPLRTGTTLYGDHDIYYFNRVRRSRLMTRLILKKSTKENKSKEQPKKTPKTPVEPGIVRLNWSF